MFRYADFLSRIWSTNLASYVNRGFTIGGGGRLLFRLLELSLSASDKLRGCVIEGETSLTRYGEGTMAAELFVARSKRLIKRMSCILAEKAYEDDCRIIKKNGFICKAMINRCRQIHAAFHT